MNRSTSRTLRAFAAVAATSAVVALAGPAVASSGSVYVDGFDGSNQVCRGGFAHIEGYNLPHKGTATVTEFNVVTVATAHTDKNGYADAVVGYLGEKGNVPYRVDVYDKNGNHTLTKTVVVKWVKCIE